MNRCMVSMMCLAAAIGGPVLNAYGADYDPLRVTVGNTESESERETTADDQATVRDMQITDTKRQRDIPIRVYLPASDAPVPVILLSHGLGGSRRACGYLGQHWAQRGFLVVAMQHAGSDELVWQDVPLRERMTALKQAASPANTLARFTDVKSVLDQLEKWNQSNDHSLHQRMNLEKVGMSGHSYGASTTQGVSGQAAPRLGQRYVDKRIDAAIMLSPNRPRRTDPGIAFGKVAIPWMLMTGTKDTSPINDTTVEDRRQVYPALPDSIDKYELVLYDAEHHAFGDVQPRRNRRRDPNHHRVILAMTTAFWETHLKEDAAANAWLHGEDPTKIMSAKDEWQYHRSKAQK